MTAKGERVGVIIYSDKDKKQLVVAGSGTYVGDFVPVGAAGMGKMLEEAEIPNPKIELDNGSVAWGCEVWWGAEEEVNASIENLKSNGFVVVEVNMDDYRNGNY
jgi:hypothetical protein